MIVAVNQHPSFALGNFINVMPAVRYWHKKLGRRLPVKYHTEYVRQCFLDCPFLVEVDELPAHDLLICSSQINRNNTEPDYLHIYHRNCNRRWLKQYHTYVDVPRDKQWATYGHVVVMNGTGNQDWQYINKKDPGAGAFRLLSPLMKDRKSFFTGTSMDRDRSYLPVDGYVLDDIRTSLKLISQAGLVITNDTGLAHAAGAMNVPTIIIWKDTLRPKNHNPGTYTINVHVSEVTGAWVKEMQEKLLSGRQWKYQAYKKRQTDELAETIDALRQKMQALDNRRTEIGIRLMCMHPHDEGYISAHHRAVEIKMEIAAVERQIQRVIDLMPKYRRKEFNLFEKFLSEV